MAITDDYSKTTWINGSSPAINETNLNKIEQGIYDNREYIQILNTNIQTVDAKNSYTTNEEVIGTWITGETLYRRLYKITSGLPAAKTQGSLDVSECNIKQCTRCEGWETTSNYQYIPMTYWFGSDSRNYMFCTNRTTVTYYYSWLPTELYILLEYTKNSS